MDQLPGEPRSARLLPSVAERTLHGIEDSVGQTLERAETRAQQGETKRECGEHEGVQTLVQCDESHEDRIVQGLVSAWLRDLRERWYVYVALFGRRRDGVFNPTVASETTGQSPAIGQTPAKSSVGRSDFGGEHGRRDVAL